MKYIIIGPIAFSRVECILIGIKKSLNVFLVAFLCTICVQFVSSDFDAYILLSSKKMFNDYPLSYITTCITNFMKQKAKICSR